MSMSPLSLYHNTKIPTDVGSLKYKITVELLVGIDHPRTFSRYIRLLQLYISRYIVGANCPSPYTDQALFFFLRAQPQPSCEQNFAPARPTYEAVVSNRKTREQTTRFKKILVFNIPGLRSHQG